MLGRLRSQGRQGGNEKVEGGQQSARSFANAASPALTFLKAEKNFIFIVTKVNKEKTHKKP